MIKYACISFVFRLYGVGYMALNCISQLLIEITLMNCNKYNHAAVCQDHSREMTVGQSNTGKCVCFQK